MQHIRVSLHEGRSPKIMNCNVEEDIFIGMVRLERPLWDKKNRDYKNLEVKNRIWKSIAEKCETTDLECKRRWTGLREKYRREKIYNCKQRRLGMVVDFTQRWRNYLNMIFLDQVYTPRGNYQKSNGTISVDENDQLNEVKYEDDSSDECDVNDFLETSVHSHTNNNDYPTETSLQSSSNYPSVSSSQLNEESLNGNRATSTLSRAQQIENFPRIWVNSLPNLSIIPKNLKEHVHDESSSASLSQQSTGDHKSQTQNNHHEIFPNKSVNKYNSFGQYIADTLHEMDEKYANELHVHILQEIIKIKSKILKES